MGNSNFISGTTPIWVKTFAYLMGTVGFPIVVASFLLAKDAGYIGQDLRHSELAKILSQNQILSLQNQKILELICTNDAESTAELHACIRFRNGGGEQ